MPISSPAVPGPTVKSYRPCTPLGPLGEGAKADCTEDQFDQYLTETSTVVDRIVERMNRS